jgi:hypothetical protein
MDPVQKMWFYEQWLGDHRDKAELTKNHALLVGSFSNPEAVQKMINPNTHESSEEDLQESMRIVSEFGKKQELLAKLEQQSPKKRKRKMKLKEQQKQG